MRKYREGIAEDYARAYKELSALTTQLRKTAQAVQACRYIEDATGRDDMTESSRRWMGHSALAAIFDKECQSMLYMLAWVTGEMRVAQSYADEAEREK